MKRIRVDYNQKDDFVLISFLDTPNMKPHQVDKLYFIDFMLGYGENDHVDMRIVQQ